MPPLKLDDDAVLVLQKISLERKHSSVLRNVAEQISVLETNRDITAATTILPTTEGANFPSVINKKKMKVILAMKEKFCTKCF
jgi:hypothetical protein